MSPIVYWNREKKQEEVESVYGGSFVDLIYGNIAGQKVADWVLSKPWFSKIYGSYQASSASRHKVSPFVRNFNIQMNEYQGEPFATFNDFFIRKFKKDARTFVQDPKRMAAFSEARYFAFKEVKVDQVFPIKGGALSAAGLLADEKKAKPFIGGSVLLARLCPVDYHRFHYPDSGRTLDSYRVAGGLHSVNPLALKYREEIFISNERHVSILDTENFGKLAYVEVGALCVGKIVQTHSSDRFLRGDEKGYFLFGGSTVILLGEPGKWTPDEDLLKETAQGREVFVKLGDALARA